MAITITLSPLNSVASGIIGVRDWHPRASTLSSSCSYSPRQVVASLVNNRSSYSKLFHNKNCIQFSSRLNPIVQSRRITILPSSKQFSCCSRTCINNPTSLEEGGHNNNDNNNDNASTRPSSSDDRLGGSSSSLLSISRSSCSCNYNNNDDKNKIANTSPSRMEGLSSLSSSSSSCSCNYNNNAHENNISNTSPSSYDRICGSSSSSFSSSLSSRVRPCSCNCQNTSPSIQINIVFPQLYASSTIGMVAHVYSKIHPLLDQVMLFVQDKSLFFFQIAVSDKERALRRKLNKIAENADTSTLNGLNYVLKEVVKVLQYHNSSIHFTKLNTDYGFLKSLSKAYEEFINRELESHGKVENIFANIDDNVEYKNEGSMVKANSSIENEYTVVTLLVLATGRHLIPNFKGKGARYQKSLEVLQAKGDRGRCYDSFEVLQTLERIPKNELQSVEVLWSPRKEDKVLLEDELLRDFPRLIPIENGLLYGKVEA